MKLHLKVKCASLAAEARIIRNYERSLIRSQKRLRDKAALAAMDPERQATLTGSVERMGDRFMSLYRHRTVDVRREARSSHIAYCFLRGTDYSLIESQGCYTDPDFKKIEEIALRFADEDSRSLKQRFAEWKDRAAVVQLGKAPKPIRLHKPGTKRPTA